MKATYTAAAIMAALLSAAATARPQAAIAAIATPTGPQVLRAGTSVPMRTMIDLTTDGKKLHVGDRVPLEVAESVRLSDQIVIPAGSPGMSEITSVRNKGMWGKSGGLTARVLYVRVGDRQIRLSGTYDDKGKTGTAAVVGAVVLVPVVGFFVTGTSAKIAKGTPVAAFLDEDVPVTFAPGTAPATTALVVPQAAALTTVAATPTAPPKR